MEEDTRCEIEKCGFIDNDVYYAPTCNIVEWICPKCGHIVDLEKVTGITYEDAFNIDTIKDLCNEFKKHSKTTRVSR